MTLDQVLTLPSGQVLKNRFVKSAMSERLADKSGAPNRGHMRLYERWSRGGAALLITGNVMVDGSALGETGNVWLENEQDLPRFAEWAAAARQDGTHAIVQLNHPGRQSPRTLTREPVAPSAVPVRMVKGAFAVPRALREDEIEALIERFARAAALSVAAGFDGVQLHAAHGYLINQFLSPLTNLRDDAWGGTPEKRRRFLMELVRRVRAAIGDKAILAVKLNSADFQRGGFDEDESLNVVRALDAQGIDLLEVSGGTYESARMFDEPKSDRSAAREAFFLDYADKVRAISRVPLLVTGGFRSAAGMNAALASGALDLVGMARPLASEPDLPARLLSGRATEAIRPKLGTGNKTLDPLVQGSWYQAQIARMAGGREPKPSLSRLVAVALYFSPKRAVRSLEA
jgi:2,4-dienoyl-CoA reductase-like NADH-dependent reductase (Old Yellow Enzyme family)